MEGMIEVRLLQLANLLLVEWFLSCWSKLNMSFFHVIVITHVQLLLLPAALTLLGEKTSLLSPETVIASGIRCCR